MKKFLVFLLSILSAFCIYAESAVKEMYIVGAGKIKLTELKELIKFSYSNTQFFLMLVIAIALIFFYKKYFSVKKKTGYKVLSFFFAFFLVFGYSYSIAGSSYLIFGNYIVFLISIIRFISYYFFISTVMQVFTNYLLKLDLSKFKEKKFLKKFKNYYEAHPYKMTILVLLIAWLPYIISFYPAILSPDPSNQIKQYYGIETHYITGVNLVDENVLITNHHPVFHTFILGGFTRIGDMMGSLNFGLFLFTCFQLFVVISALSYLLVYLKKQNVPFIIRFITLLLFAFVPVFPLYALSAVKDTMFGALLIFYIIEIHKMLTNSYRKRDYATLGLLILIMMLVRNNGIYIILLSLPAVAIMVKEKRLAIFVTLFLSIFVYEAHNKILLPVMHITEGSIREMLSVPFQQTARYVKYYGDEVTEEKRSAIDKILGYDTLAERYKPNLADPVKNQFNPDATKEDLKNYFKVWFQGFLHHPGVYIDATINTIYGYFYPNTSNWYIYYNYDKRLPQSGLDYHYNELGVVRNTLSSIGVAFPYIPILGAIVNIGFLVWIYLYLFTFMLVEKQKKYISLLLPAFVLLLTIIVGPVNTYFRYIFPILVSLPLILGLVYQAVQETRK